MIGKDSNLVSAIILTHNRVNLLKRAIDSVINQTYPNIECIVVDNSSTDGTREYCLSRGDVRYIYCSPPEETGNGCNYSRNIGIKACNGDLVALLDDDDYWMPTKIEKQVKLMQEKGCGVVYCGTKAEIVGEETRLEEWPVNHEKEGDMSKTCLLHPFVLTSQLLIKKDLLESVGLFDEKLQFMHESELMIRLCQVTPVYAVDECLMGYRVDIFDKGRQTNKLIGWREAFRYIYRKNKTLLSQLNHSDKIQINRAYAAYAYGKSITEHLHGYTVLYYLLLKCMNAPRKFNRIVKSINNNLSHSNNDVQ